MEPGILKTLKQNPWSLEVEPIEVRRFHMYLESCYLTLGRFEEAMTAALWLIEHFESNPHDLEGNRQCYFLKNTYHLLCKAADGCHDPETEAYAIIRYENLRLKLTRNPFERLLANVVAMNHLMFLGSWAEELVIPFTELHEKCWTIFSAMTSWTTDTTPKTTNFRIQTVTWKLT